MVAAASCGALYNVLAGRYLRRHPALGFTAYAMAFGVAALGVGLALDGRLLTPPALSWAGWIAVLFLGVIGCALAFYLWVFGLSHTTPTRVAITVTLNPVTAMTLGGLLLGEPVSLRLVLGVAAVLAGILLASWQRGGLQPALAATPSTRSAKRG